MNLLPVSELAARSGFVDLFIIGCIVFYIAHRVVRQEWGSDDANKMRTVIAWTFYSFGVVLLVTSLARIPGCEKNRANQQIEQHNIPGAQSKPDPKADVTNNKKENGK